MLAQMAFASPTQSAAFDEGYTITYGYAYLHTGDARLSRGQNPPLTNVFIALPLLLRDDVVFPIDHPTWAKADIYGFSDEFLWKANVDRAAKLVQLARLPEMALALLLACIVYVFTRSLFGRSAALFALLLCVFDPNILAHGHIVGTDLGVTLFIFSAVWMWTTALKQMSLRRTLIAGLLTGAALSSKYSAVWLTPILLFVALAYPGLCDHWKLRVKLMIALGVAAFVVIWGTFAFSIGPIAPGSIPLPAPQYWESLGKVASRVESGTPAFMLDQISPTGFTLYYPFVFLVKTPLPMLIWLMVGAINLIVRRKCETLAAWFPPLLFMGASMISGLNLGYRLILPVLPFALMIAGQGSAALLTGMLRPPKPNDAEKKTGNTPWLRISVAGLLLFWLVLDTLTTAPNHLAYFNQLINPDQDYNMLVDSNLDWGQDLIALHEWQTLQRVDDLQLAYYGTARPEAYAVKAHLLPSFPLNDFGPEVDGFNAYALPPAHYAVSATSLQLGTLYSRWKLYDAFKERTPEARVGRSFLIYNVGYPSPNVDRTVVLGPLASDLDRETLGGHEDRQLIVKWAGQDAAVLDMQGRARYITRGGEPIVGFAPTIHQALLEHGVKLGSDASGELRLWEIDAQSALRASLKTWESKPIFASGGTPLKLPLKFTGGLTLLGYDLPAGSEQPIELVTYWRVDQVLSLPLSVFAHAVDAAGNIAGQGDGLNLRLSSLEPSDVFAQHFVIGPTKPVQVLRIGLYQPVTGQRFQTAGQSDHVVIRLQP
ncbi:hypothetical protein TFLX_02851 [Thermoflexales bacterium]|nr:hypothetical protein TFLX_02851 [Thermoflexales bacterium]